MLCRVPSPTRRKYRSYVLCQVKSFLMYSWNFIAILCASSGFVRSSIIASARACSSPTSTIRPVILSEINSMVPIARVQITGRPAAPASITAIGGMTFPMRGQNEKLRSRQISRDLFMRNILVQEDM